MLHLIAIVKYILKTEQFWKKMFYYDADIHFCITLLSF